ncbi:MAG TPA: M48 family metalloprotease, partial [Candidatus Dormibacteraeota bacterium]|nr:M48 family metalloprotease [Candidatus Dormibacteraeota bacterium]
MGTLAAAVVPMLDTAGLVTPRGSLAGQPAVLVATVLAAATLAWWCHPALKMWRRGLRPLPAARMPAVAAALDELCAEAGLRRPPRFVWDPLQPAPWAVAFGRAGRQWVGLSGGLVVEFGRDPATFRAIVRHELAHVRNGDVPITSFALAIWWAFVALALAPFVLLNLPAALAGRAPFHLAPWAWTGTWAWRFAALALLVLFSRNSVLRVREVHADLRAAAWDGPAGALRRVLERLPRRLWWWPEAWSVHPDPARRRLLLDDAEPLFEIGFWEALGTGWALSLAATDLTGAALLTGRGLAPFVVVPALLSLLGAGVVGLGLWRSAWAAGRRPRWIAVGLGLGAGLPLGPNLSLDAVTLEVTGRGRFAGLRPALPDLLVDLVVVAGSLLVAWWMAGCAAAWVEGRPRGEPVPRLALVGGLAAGGVVLGGLVELGLAAALLVGMSGPGALSSLLIGSFLSVPGAVVAACLWLLPVLARGGPRWPSVRLGLRAGAIFWPLAILDVFVLRPPGQLHNLGLAFAALMAVTGFLGARRGGPGAVPRGLLAAFA